MSAGRVGKKNKHRSYLSLNKRILILTIQEIHIDSYRLFSQNSNSNNSLNFSNIHSVKSLGNIEKNENIESKFEVKCPVNGNYV